MQSIEDEILDTLETLMAQSLHQHEQMIGLLGELNHQLTTHSTDFIENFNETFSALQQETQQTDRHLLALLGHAGIPDAARQLFARRTLLQEGILQLLKDSEPRARNIKSLLASEMQSLTAGRRALHGYRNVTDRQGTIINSAR